MVIKFKDALKLFNIYLRLENSEGNNETKTGIAFSILLS